MAAFKVTFGSKPSKSRLILSVLLYVGEKTSFSSFSVCGVPLFTLIRAYKLFYKHNAMLKAINGKRNINIP